MSYRLQSQGHTPVAVDLLTNNQDGLGAATHYTERLGSLFPRVQAELDNLPFADSQFDLAIFNASFHYSENYEKTLAEALRCVRNGGMVVIADYSVVRRRMERAAHARRAPCSIRPALWLSIRRTPEPGISYRPATAGYRATLI